MKDRAANRTNNGRNLISVSLSPTGDEVVRTFTPFRSDSFITVRTAMFNQETEMTALDEEQQPTLLDQDFDSLQKEMNNEDFDRLTNNVRFTQTRTVSNQLFSKARQQVREDI